MKIPTIVIGVGMAGIKVVQSLSDLIDEHDKKNPDNPDKDYFQFIAIDSSSSDLSNVINPGSNITTIALTEERYDVPQMIDRCEYLYDGVTPHVTEALRERVYGRFLFDLNRTEVIRTIKKSIDNAAEERVGYSTQIHIWIVHSLGGGTGSGTFISLLSEIQKIKNNNENLGPRGKKLDTFCIGILPSDSDLSDLRHLEHADPKYFANAYTALKELQYLGDPKNLKIKVFNPTGSDYEIEVNKKPFERYMLFGVDEESIKSIEHQTEDNIEERKKIIDYLHSKNLIIANMIYGINEIRIQDKGIGNFWDDGIPYGAFGESEVIIPFKHIQAVARANDYLGLPVNKSKVSNEVKEIFSQDHKLDHNIIEQRCLKIFNSAGLNNFEYFIRKLDEIAGDESTKAKTRYHNKTKEIIDNLDYFHKWIKDDPYKEQFNSIKSSDYDDDKPERLISLIESRIKDLKKQSKKLTKILSKNYIKSQVTELDEHLKELENLKYSVEIHFKIQKYITSNLCYNNDLIKKNLQVYYSFKEISTDDCGAGNILKIIGAIKQKIANYKDKQIGDKVYENYRVIKLGVPVINKKLIDEIYKDKINSTYGKDNRAINSAEVSNAKKYINEFKIETGYLNELWKNRIRMADSYDVNPRITPQKRNWDPYKEVFIMRDIQNNEALEQIQNITPRPKVVNISDKHKFIILSFNHGFLLNETNIFRNRDKEYNEGSLHEILDNFSPENIGQLFAYPEFFPDDENITNIFTKMYPKE